MPTRWRDRDYCSESVSENLVGFFVTVCDIPQSTTESDTQLNGPEGK